MRLFAIGDLHLSPDASKPMDVFGSHWAGHWPHIQEDWQRRVAPQDTVLIPGDISWAMGFDEARANLNDIAGLPGQKIILRGNHDYWWPSLKRLGEYAPNIQALQNNAYRIGSTVICGSRGWLLPGTSAYAQGEDEKIYQREALRLELSLKAGQALRQPGDNLLVMMHYPPRGEQIADTAFTELFAAHGVERVIYGHMHGPNFFGVVQGMHGGISYKLVSCDYLGFVLTDLGEA